MSQRADAIADLIGESAVLEITALGGTAFYAVLALYLVLADKAGHALAIFAAYIISAALAAIFRIVYFKPRPEQREFTTFFGKLLAAAFPSLHTMRAFMYAVMFGSWLGSRAALAVFLLIAALVGWSRTRLKMHDWADVSAGAAMGVVLGVAVLNIIPA